jgi:glycosyltransferase involved in cell wall biosynthesis
VRPRQAFVIAGNGFAEGPAQALRDLLVARNADVTTIFHPLTPEQGKRHVITTYAAGERRHERTVRLPLRPPLSFALDPLVPVVPPRADTWFGFNPLACARGLLARKQGRARSVVLWSVDFVPDRFGPGTLPTRLYDRLDRLSCLSSNARVELSEAARDARARRHALPDDAPVAHVVPMGAWLERVPTTRPDGFRRRRAVFLGHLVSRQGVETLLEAVALLVARNEGITADIVGGGPLEETLRTRAAKLGLREHIHFHGFVADHRDVERILASSSVATAPYATVGETFTRYADPGKLKAYLAAGLPIVLTDVPPNATELAQEAGAEIVDDDSAALAEALSRSLDSGELWLERRDAALAYARRFDWGTLLPDALEQMGIDLSAGAARGLE